jgi:hypothetical protein
MSLIVFVVASILAGVFLRHLVSSVNTHRDALTTVRTATGQVAAGVGLTPGALIEIQGAAKPAPFCPTIVSPLSRNNCVWWRADLQKKNDDSWTSKHIFTSAPWLGVDDGTGPVLVNLLEHSPEATTETHHESNIPEWLTGAQLALAAKGERIALETPPPGYSEPTIGGRIVRGLRVAFDETEPISSLGGTWRIIEHFIRCDSPVYVIGSATYDQSRENTILRPIEGQAFRVRVGTETDLVRSASEGQRSALIATTVASIFVGGAFPITHWVGLSVLNWIAAIVLPVAVLLGGKQWVASRQRDLTKPDTR